jgi:hypothetical protein
MDEQGRRSISYLLRLWRVEGSDEPGWRASLEALGGERLAFVSIDELFAYLHWQAGLPPRSAPEWNDPAIE